MNEYRIKERKKRIAGEKGVEELPLDREHTSSRRRAETERRSSRRCGKPGRRHSRRNEKDRRKSRKRRGRKRGGILSTIILIVAVIVFCFSGFQLFRIFYGYHKGDQEYDQLKELAVTVEKDNTQTGEDRYSVDFDELRKVNQDIIAWIRFDEPSIISYPVVQGKDNQEYLDKTISGYPNTYGAIFLNVTNSKDMTDKNSIIYGHRMNSKSMFGKLEEYQDEEFFKAYPYFYIYTPDGQELKYQIFAVGEVKDTSEAYQTVFENDQEFQSFLTFSKEHCFYDTKVEVPSDAKVVTLSTCTKANNDERLIVQGYQIEVN